jgi:hypothetical protein
MLVRANIFMKYMRQGVGECGDLQKYIIECVGEG